MTPLLKKLNYREGQTVYCFNAPDTFLPVLSEMKAYTTVLQDPLEVNKVDFALVFATKQAEVDHYANLLGPRLNGDALLWFCYPKGTSKRYKCEFNRDTGWAALGAHNLEGVRQIAVDEDWSALRFRKINFIKTMTRRESMALSAEGKKKTTGRQNSKG